MVVSDCPRPEAPEALVIVTVVDVRIVPMVMPPRRVDMPVGVGRGWWLGAIVGVLMVFIVRVSVLVR